MLLTLYLVFVALSLILMIIGFFGDIVIFSLIGSVMFFSLGIILLDDPLTYSVGENIELTYGANLSNVWADNGGVVPSNTDAYVFGTNNTQIYESYDDAGSTRFGWLMASGGAFAFVLALFML